MTIRNGHGLEKRYSNSTLTDSLWWMRLMASANSGAADSSARCFGSCFSGGSGMLSVTTICLRGASRSRSMAGAAQHAVRGAGVDLAGPVAAGHVRRPDHAAGRRNHVVEDHHHLAFQRGADQVGLPRLRGAERRLSTMAMAPPSFF